MHCQLFINRQKNKVRQQSFQKPTEEYSYKRKYKLKETLIHTTLVLLSAHHTTLLLYNVYQNFSQNEYEPCHS